MDNDKPIGKLSVIDNFLPNPEELVRPTRTKKITISLTESSIDFFKNQAEKHHTKYQRMIRNLVEKYAKKYSSTF
jgi:predicted DNA binding CopG/RHH family protein